MRNTMKHQLSLLTLCQSNKIRPSFWIQCVFILLFAFALFGPITNLLIWTVAETWYFPHALPSEWGLNIGTKSLILTVMSQAP
ncbi:hypothetical protein O1D97_14380 [Marinomonas sp. 15G1-11]|uniref:Uncharacterized protein n=1 Tax=Marinomonas phaeophyticola TaxID=3004091 RepID=A0ABT4JWM4_9GAMM|nr:hypothetical protein [Marinomonas sp. 15G1-11]MCZ2722765.1 hypothetical protein [Marinomonas sp. 15G1-11]